jgi:hypothetical protein
MTQTRPNDCTEYKSLYPTDSTNEQIAIPRIAGNRSDGGDERTLPEPPLRDLVSTGRPDEMSVQRIFQPCAAILDELVEALHRLLLDVPESDALGGQTPPCFSVRKE